MADADQCPGCGTTGLHEHWCFLSANEKRAFSYASWLRKSSSTDEAERIRKAYGPTVGRLERR